MRVDERATPSKHNQDVVVEVRKWYVRFDEKGQFCKCEPLYFPM